MAQGSGPETSTQDVTHATTVCVDGKGILIIGPPGAGKSALALSLMAHGGILVADDRTIIQRRSDTLRASAPPTIRGQIEARGVGILNVPDGGPTDIVLVVDLFKTADARLPEPQTHNILGVDVECLHRAPHAHFAAAILFYVKGITYPPHDAKP